jgi:hypothetical protein
MRLPLQSSPVARTHDHMRHTGAVTTSWESKCHKGRLWIKRQATGDGGPYLAYTCGADRDWDPVAYPTTWAPKETSK